MAGQYDKLMRQIGELRRQLSNSTMNGTVHEVKGDRLRLNLGKDSKGQDVIGPWIHTGNHRGGAREARFYKKGQNVSLMAPGGDISQAMVVPYGPNKDFKRPDHAASTGQDEETYQQEDFRKKRTKEGDDSWLEPPEEKKEEEQGEQPDGGGTGAGSGSKIGGQPHEKDKEGTTGGDKATMKRRMNKDSGHTLRVGKDVRAHIHKDGATISHKDNHVFVDKDTAMLSMAGGQVWVDKDGIWSSKPIQVKSPPKTKPGWDFDDK